NSGTLTLKKCDVHGNFASLDGGGIANFGKMVINGRNIYDNRATGVSYPDPVAASRVGVFIHYGGVGGGIANLGSNAYAQLSNVDVYNNIASRQLVRPGDIISREVSGGGIYNEGTMTYNGGHIYDNSANLGGAIFNAGSMPTAGVNEGTLR